ncbi:MAG: ribonuclease HI [Myxococcales bacterium]|nr:ribonuclease HI [Myxococcales bacterium]|tara:strand:+ start:1423 stop:1854 length:432 start_codon:yes stop_codon:yes gene_type:complete
MTDELNAWTDGACSGNPGPGGWGVVLQWRDYEKTLSGGELETTNNRMELMAAIQALASVHRAVPVHLRTDSQYVIKGITEWSKNWKKNGWQTKSGSPVKNEDLWRRLDTLCGQLTVKWTWVKGHAGNEMNERADELARSGIPT